MDKKRDVDRGTYWTRNRKAQMHNLQPQMVKSIDCSRPMTILEPKTRFATSCGSVRMAAACSGGYRLVLNRAETLIQTKRFVNKSYR